MPNESIPANYTVEISPATPLFSGLQSIETRERLFRTKGTA
jgi:hypothetical protein